MLDLAAALKSPPAIVDGMPLRDAVALSHAMANQQRDQHKWEAALRGVEL